MFENPIVNPSALCNSSANIAFCSSELKIAFLYAGSSIQNVSQQFVWCIHLLFSPSSSFPPLFFSFSFIFLLLLLLLLLLRSSSNLTNKCLTELFLEIPKALSR